MSGKIIKLNDGVEGLFIQNARFNTTLVSFNFYLPLTADTVAVNALLPFVLTTCCAKYPNFRRLNYKLNKLYGAQLDASTEKCGDQQLLRISISVINDTFSLENESLIGEATALLLRLLFEPKVEDGAFFDEDVSREKRKAIEHIRGEISEKRTYAKNRMIEEMFAGDVYGLPKCGKEADVAAITGTSLFAAWQRMLCSAYVRVHMVGAGIPSGLFEEISERFGTIKRTDVTLPTPAVPAQRREKPLCITEQLSVQQGKLVMGFSSEMAGDDETTLPLLVMCDIFGGGPYSRLFTNVREKMSLCYYCAARSMRQKGLVTVDSGVESEYAEKAQKEILNQLQIIQRGKFSDFEFESSLKSIKDSLSTYNDSQISLDLWYALRVANKTPLSPDEMAEQIADVTKDQVTAAAKGVFLNTVYSLLPKEETNE